MRYINLRLTYLLSYDFVVTRLRYDYDAKL